MKQCCRCLIRTEYDVDLDSYGICSYCRILDKHSDLASKIGKQGHLLRERLSLFRNTGQYDCIVGLSGGKDSSYIVYRLKSHYGARLLTFTYDNGFLTEFAKKNIESIVKGFEVDHIWVRPKAKVLQGIYTGNLSNEGWPCSACIHMGESAIWKLAYENKIPFIVSGRTPEQILRRPDSECFESPFSIIADNFAPYDNKRARQLAANTLQRIDEEKQWLLSDRNLWPEAAEDLYLAREEAVTDDFAPEYLAFFLYEEHDEFKMMDVLEKKTCWKGPDKRSPLAHHDCAAHDAAGYLYYRKHGVPFIGLEKSALIRLNKLSQKEGKQIFDKEINSLSHCPQESIAALSKVSGVQPFNIRLLPAKAKLKKFLKSKIKKLFRKG